MPGFPVEDPYSISRHQNDSFHTLMVGEEANRVVRSPTTRFSPDIPVQAQVSMGPAPLPNLGFQLDRNIQPQAPQNFELPLEPLGFERHKPQSPPRRIFGSLGLGSWAQLSAQALHKVMWFSKASQHGFGVGPCF